jgi:hypothetical protein
MSPIAISYKMIINRTERNKWILSLSAYVTTVPFCLGYEEPITDNISTERSEKFVDE